MSRASGTSSRKIVAAERRRTALTLRRAGLTFQAIGDAIGISRARAHRLVADELAVLAENAAGEAAIMRTLELDRLD